MQRTVLFDFIPRNQQELPLNKGDVIQTVSTHSDVGAGWWVGKKITPNGTLVGVFPANYTSNTVVSKVYSPKVSPNISRKQKDIGKSLLNWLDDMLSADNGTPSHSTSITINPTPSHPPNPPPLPPSPSPLVPKATDNGHEPQTSYMVQLLQQDVKDREDKIYILEKTKKDLEKQLKQIAVDSELKILALEGQIQDLQHTTQTITSQFTDKLKIVEAKQKREMLAKDEEIQRLQDMNKSYKLDILELNNRLDLEEQTVQALEEYRLNLELDLRKLSELSSLPTSTSTSIKLTPMASPSNPISMAPSKKIPLAHPGVSISSTCKVLEKDLIEVMSRFMDLSMMLKRSN